MSTHVKVVAALHILFGALGLLAATIIFTLFGTAGGIVIWNGEVGPAAIVGTVGLCIGGLIAILSIPGIIGGWALLAGKEWARVLIIVLGILELIHFPLGTALGVYTLWIMFAEEQRRRPEDLPALPDQIHPVA
ncbi:MAG: hypothetical protein AB9869_06350 [Verrucomicrobiia bacterium]